jgi:hypothetical protein
MLLFTPFAAGRIRRAKLPGESGAKEVQLRRGNDDFLPDRSALRSAKHPRMLRRDLYRRMVAVCMLCNTDKYGCTLVRT